MLLINRDLLKAEARIIVADDMELNRAMISAIYQAEGFVQIKQASNGQEVMDLVEHWKPDLILLDLMMPVMDGAEVCNRIRKKPGHNPPVIIVQTALEDNHHKTKLFELGVSDYVVKPINQRELLLRSYVHLEKRAMVQSLKAYNENMKEEMVQAAAVQQELLPPTQIIDEYSMRYGIDLAALHQSSIAIGGDIWGVKAIDDQRLALFVADIAGHGVKAALGAARLDVLIRGLEHTGEPSAFLKKLNSRLYHMLSRGSYATMIYVVLDTQKKSLHYATAGAHPPLVVHAEGQVEDLPGSGLPLGIQEDVIYDTHTVPFTHGARCLLYSDALVESVSWVGVDTAIDILKNKENTAEETIGALQRILFSEDARLSLDDDLTMVAAIVK